MIVHQRRRPHREARIRRIGTARCINCLCPAMISNQLPWSPQPLYAISLNAFRNLVRRPHFPDRSHLTLRNERSERLHGSSIRTTSGFRVAPRFGAAVQGQELLGAGASPRASTDGVGGQMSTQTPSLTPGSGEVPAPRAKSRRRTLYRGDPGMWSWVLHRDHGCDDLLLLVRPRARYRVGPGEPAGLQRDHRDLQVPDHRVDGDRAGRRRPLSRAERGARHPDRFLGARARSTSG